MLSVNTLYDLNIKIDEYIDDYESEKTLECIDKYLQEDIFVESLKELAREAYSNINKKLI